MWGILSESWYLFKELSQCKVVRISVEVACLHNFQYLMFVKLWIIKSG